MRFFTYDIIVSFRFRVWNSQCNSVYHKSLVFCLCFQVFQTPIVLSCELTGIVVTNDGNAILRELDIAHPAAKVLVSLLFIDIAILTTSCNSTVFWFALKFLGLVPLWF